MLTFLNSEITIGVNVCELNSTGKDIAVERCQRNTELSEKCGGEAVMGRM